MRLFDAFQKQYSTILVDAPWTTIRRSDKRKPPKRLIAIEDVEAIPIWRIARPSCHLYLWCANGRLADGLRLLASWDFNFETTLVWIHSGKYRAPVPAGESYFREATEMLLFAWKGRRRRRVHSSAMPNAFHGDARTNGSRPQAAYDLIESCSTGPYLEMFAREPRVGWDQWRGTQKSPRSIGTRR